ncbi:MAG: voltage-gated potassium channel [Candidatus Endobugula sp.]|jgi:voltage-gated potassium channel
MFFLKQAMILSYRRKRLTKHLSTSVIRRVSTLFLILLLLIFVNSAGMIYFEGMKLGDAIWLSFTTLTTVGYGDFSPTTISGRVITIITMYSFAITILSLLAAEVIESRLVKSAKKKKGYWEWREMTDHIQIINTPVTDSERYLSRLVKELHKTPRLGELSVQLLTRKYPEGLPHSLEALQILHRTGAAEDGVILHNINLDLAAYIIILARDATNSLSDSVTFDILSQVVSINPTAHILVEAVLDDNRQRFMAAGAKAVLRPVRAYPEMIVRALCHPGTEQVLEDLFETHGASFHNIPCKLKNISWQVIVMTCIQHQLGTPVAFFDGVNINTQPNFDAQCSADALVMLVKENTVISEEQVNVAFSP